MVHCTNRFRNLASGGKGIHLNYLGYELAHAFISPMRFWSTAARLTLDHPLSLLSLNPFAKSASAALEVFEIDSLALLDFDIGHGVGS